MEKFPIGRSMVYLIERRKSTTRFNLVPRKTLTKSACRELPLYQAYGAFPSGSSIHGACLPYFIMSTYLFLIFIDSWS